ncbi:Rad52/Rad22 family DNA repair protein [Oricola indica]|jgi:DNA recombination protein Rad52|uniref:Rad52/Rad22 family DNA repair protein n=1 Tax=Oricola indica TaxID=2872591 RepID=UPI001CBF48C7|nr:RAD52 family DNA repair protein [Oricola indica]
MSFDAKQIRQLRAKLKPRHVRARTEDGITLYYLEGWHVIGEANRIFGFDGWNRETVESTCVYTKHLGVRFEAVYVARVRVTVATEGGTTITREGSGTGEASTSTPGKAHELALKAAETDATKRALMTFGNAFGLSLYDPNGSHRTAVPQAINGRYQDGGIIGASPVSKDAAIPTETSCDKSDPGKGRGSNRGTNGATIACEAVAQHATPQMDPINGSGPTASKRKDSGSSPQSDHLPAIDAGRDQAGKGGTYQTDEGVSNHRPQCRIDKSTLTLSEPKRVRDPEHLRFVVTNGCAICGRNRTHAHHLTFAQPHALGRKVSDEFTVPLCAQHHGELHHAGNEEAWWRDHKLDPLAIADDLWMRSRKKRMRL